MNELLSTAAVALRKAAINEDAKNYVLRNKPLFDTLKRAANRYIGGENLKETIVKVKAHNSRVIDAGLNIWVKIPQQRQKRTKRQRSFYGLVSILQMIN